MSSTAIALNSLTQEVSSCSFGRGSHSAGFICFMQNIWKARCVGQWNIPVLTSCRGWRALHGDLVHCLTLVDGTAQNIYGDYDNVIAIVNVLDTYRTLAEIVRACFDRLGLLLEGHEAREATKAMDKSIMDHALWTLNTYPDDIDLQLVINSRVSLPCVFN